MQKKKFDKMVGEEVLSKRISDIFLFRNKTKLFPSTKKSTTIKRGVGGGGGGGGGGVAITLIGKEPRQYI